MKIVQSLWSRPSLVGDGDGVDTRQAGGWLQEKYYHMGLTLSCLQLARYYGEVELVTDAAGKTLLIDRLGLPYHRVVQELDRLNGYHGDLWALGKLYAYRLQDEPFLHVDGDVFIWKRFDPGLTAGGVIAQHLEKGYPFYRKVLRQLDMSKVQYPKAIDEYRKRNRRLHAYNMGIAGGRDVDLFKTYTEEAFRFVDANVGLLEEIAVGYFNPVYEQVLFYCMLYQHGKAVNLYTRTTGERRVDREMKGLRNFVRAPEKASYIHLYGPAKKDIYYCNELERKIKNMYPQHYERIMDNQHSTTMQWKNLAAM